MADGVLDGDVHEVAHAQGGAVADLDVGRCTVELASGGVEQGLNLPRARVDRRAVGVGVRAAAPPALSPVGQPPQATRPARRDPDGAVPDPGRSRYHPGPPIRLRSSRCRSTSRVTVPVSPNAVARHGRSAIVTPGSSRATSNSSGPSSDSAVTSAWVTTPTPLHHGLRPASRQPSPSRLAATTCSAVRAAHTP